MCGICGYIPKANIIQKKICEDFAPAILKQCLVCLQHRGYDGCGLAMHPENGNKSLVLFKTEGRAVDALTTNELNKLPNTFGIGHTRYKTHGSVKVCQPLISKNKKIALVHNGQITADDYEVDSLKLLQILEEKITFNLDTQEEVEKNEYLLIKILNDIHCNVNFSYSCLVLIENYGIIAFRDSHGIRPLVYGMDEHQIVIASEDIALHNLGLDSIDILPRQSLIFKMNGEIIDYRVIQPEIKLTPCIFEYIYFAHPDSTLNGISVRRARQKFGKLMGKEIQKLKLDIDIVIPVPDSSCLPAETLATFLGKTYLPILQLRKKSRTFILPNQEARKLAIQDKFYLDEELKSECDGKNVLIVDDSIVRGNTLNHIVSMIKNLKPKKLYIGSFSPPVKFHNRYGIDLPTQNELIAYQKTFTQIAEELGVEKVIYLKLNKMIESLKKLNPKIDDFEASLFNGKYLNATPIPKNLSQTCLNK